MPQSRLYHDFTLNVSLSIVFFLLMKLQNQKLEFIWRQNGKCLQAETMNISIQKKENVIFSRGNPYFNILHEHEN